MTFADWFGMGTVIVIVVVTAACYGHAGRTYAEGKSERIPSPSGFALVYRYIQLSTIGLGVATFAWEHPALLRLHTDPVLVYGASGVALLGLLLFVAKGAAPDDTTMQQIMVSVAPFIAMALVVVALLIYWPDLTLVLPNLISR